jgi:tetratricopeptide (TPR) repeat protein/CHAT domain-containing protein
VFLIFLTIVCTPVSQGVTPTGTEAPQPGSGSSGSAPTSLSYAAADLQKLLKEGDYAEAESGARKLLEAQERAAPGDLKGRIDILDVLVMSLCRLWKVKNPETEGLAKEAVELSRRVYGEEDLIYARALNTLGNVYFPLKKLEAAQEAWEQALTIRRKTLGPDHPDVAKSLNNLGLVHQESGDYAGALPFFEQAKTIREKVLGPDHPDVASTLNNIGNQMLFMADYQGAIEAHQRALAIREKALRAEHPLIAESLTNLGEAYYAMKDFQHARPVYERALAVNEKAFPNGNPYLASDKGDLGRLLLELGDYPAALAQLQEALAIDEKLKGPQDGAVSIDLQVVSDLYAKLGRQTEALQAAQRAVSIQEKRLGTEHVSVSVALETLSSRYFETAQYQKSLDVLGRALAIVEKVLGPTHVEVAEVLQGMADSQVQLGSLAEAGRNYDRALSIQEAAFGPTHVKVGELLLKLAKLNWRTGKWEATLDHSLTSEGVLRRQFIQIAPALSEREALQYEIARSSGVNLSISSLLALSGEARRQAIPKVWDAIIQSRALVLDEMAARHAAFTLSADTEIARKARALTASRNRLARLVIEGPPQDDPSGYRKDLSTALSEKEQAERDLAASSSEFQRRSESRKGYQEVASCLPKQTVLVAYLAFDRLGPPAGGKMSAKRSYVAFVLGAGKAAPSVVELGGADAIDFLVQDWRKGMSPSASGITGLASRPEEQIAAAGAKLRKAVWDPLAPEIQGARMVFVVFDGALNLVNLAALPSDDGRFVLESGPTLHYLGAERDLARPRRASPAPGGLLALGGPDFDASSAASPEGGPVASMKPAVLPRSMAHASYRSAPIACGGFPSIHFSPLAASTQEAQAIDSLWRSTSNRGKKSPTLVLTGSAATEAAMKQRAPEFRVIHLATHGYFLDDRCDSSFEQARRAPESPMAVGPVGESPLLLSGLALAGANRRGDAGAQDEDGILTAEEISSLDLSGVDWAVLSACETGVGRIQLGEGVLGLRRAFEVAGAGTLIMSLWRVEDQSAREWMQYLYEGRLEGMSSAEAVRKAGLTMLKKHRARSRSTSPVSWGAFVAAGDWR